MKGLRCDALMKKEKSSLPGGFGALCPLQRVNDTGITQAPGTT